jgi:N-acetylmuramoyl-L-alanine amidase
LCDPESKVSCHYLVDENGAVFQMVEEGMRAWHAGISVWKGERDINSRSIGIEIHNPGHALGYPDFPGSQIASAIELCLDIASRHSIRPQAVLAHSDVAPGRKADPGEKFDWRELHAHGVGHWTEPTALVEGPYLRPGDSGDEVKRLQSLLATYGYVIETSGSFDSHTEATVRAFQRHFRPQRVDGRADLSTVETLRRLIAALPADQ